MLSLIGSVLGFGTSFLPKILNFFEEKRDQAHELAMIDKQIEANKEQAKIKLQMINTQGDIDALKAALSEHKSTTAKASQSFINLSASVRPVVTYAFFIEFIILTIAVNMDWLSKEEYKLIWDEPTQAIWATVVCFWFGARQYGRRSIT